MRNKWSAFNRPNSNNRGVSQDCYWGPENHQREKHLMKKRINTFLTMMYEEYDYVIFLPLFSPAIIPLYNKLTLIGNFIQHGLADIQDPHPTRGIHQNLCQLLWRAHDNLEGRGRSEWSPTKSSFGEFASLNLSLILMDCWLNRLRIGAWLSFHLHVEPY